MFRGLCTWTVRGMLRLWRIVCGPPTVLGRMDQLLVFLRVVGRLVARRLGSGEMAIGRGLRVRYESLFLFRAFFAETFLLGAYDLPVAGEAALVVDVGANDGLSLLWFALRHPRARLVGFEPQAALHALCRENLDRNGLERVELHRVALSDREGEGRLFADTEIVESCAVGLYGEGGGEGETVPMARLSTYLADADVDLMKIDVEGAEWEILRDLRDAAVLPRVRALVVEVHPRFRPEERPSEILAMLEDAGFRCVLRPMGSFDSDETDLFLVVATRP